MTQSMTAFSRSSMSNEYGAITWEIRSVNHRYCDINFRMSDTFRSQESLFRNLVKDNVIRGKLDLTLNVEPKADSLPNMEVNLALVKKLHQVSLDVAGVIGESQGITVETLLRWPGVLSTPDVATDALIETLKKGLNQALDELNRNRASEGKKLKEHILLRLTEISRLIKFARERYAVIQGQCRENLLTKLEAALDKVDNDRVEQEIVHLAQRLDISEELDRLEVHVSETHHIFNQKRGIGRRLDFMMQEFNREANTLGSKSQDSEITKISVELKVLIEQIREQVQNIE